MAILKLEAGMRVFAIYGVTHCIAEIIGALKIEKLPAICDVSVPWNLRYVLVCTGEGFAWRLVHLYGASCCCVSGDVQCGVGRERRASAAPG